ncbi:hypothetical protein ACEQ8H_006817 [Pleosporales sp. CAS-2024a]
MPSPIARIAAACADSRRVLAMDPLSFSAGAIGMTAFATASIMQLRDLIEGLSEAQYLVADVATSLANIESPINTLEQLFVSEKLSSLAVKEDLRKVGVAEAVNNCGNACSDFGKNLAKWTKHSSNSKLSLRDHLSIGVWNKEKMQASDKKHVI